MTEKSYLRNYKEDIRKKICNKKIKYLNSKDFTFLSISVKCILWQIFNEIVENQDLYRNKDDFQFFFFTKSSYILI